MSVARDLPEHSVARIQRHRLGGDGFQDRLVGRGAAIAVLGTAGKQAEARNLGPMAAVILRQPQGEGVHERVARQGIERPLLRRNAGRQAEAPAMAVGTGAPLFVQEF